MVDKSGHNVNMEQPDATAANLLRFWARAERSAAMAGVGGDAGAGAL